jgi:hypothetical protein
MVYGALRGPYEDAAEWTPMFRYLCPKCDDSPAERVCEFGPDAVSTIAGSGHGVIVEMSDEEAARRAKFVNDMQSKEMLRRHYLGLCMYCGKKNSFWRWMVGARGHAGCTEFRWQ